MAVQIKINWQDRKRILGLPITFTKYSMSADRIFYETGLLNTRMEELLLYRVRDISLRVRLSQRLFGVGTVIIQSSDKTTPILELQNIRHPREVKELLHTQVEQMKEQRRMRVEEVLDGCHSGVEDGDSGEDFAEDDLSDE